ncbi:hypothetical protein BJX66DRAFT_302989, partial [Aspergillus keveii]
MAQDAVVRSLAFWTPCTASNHAANDLPLLRSVVLAPDLAAGQSNTPCNPSTWSSFTGAAGWPLQKTRGAGRAVCPASSPQDYAQIRQARL